MKITLSLIKNTECIIHLSLLGILKFVAIAPLHLKLLPPLSLLWSAVAAAATMQLRASETDRSHATIFLEPPADKCRLLAPSLASRHFACIVLSTVRRRAKKMNSVEVVCRWNTLEIIIKTTFYKTKSLIRQRGNGLV